MPYIDGDDWMAHPCAGCGTLLSDQCPYAYCGACQETKTCPHGMLFKEPCGRCDADADFAYDAWRETRPHERTDP